MHRVRTFAVVLVAATLLLPAASAVKFSFDLGTTDAGVAADVQHVAGHYAKASAFAHTFAEHEGDCAAETGYEAEAGPIGADLGGHYTAEGDGTLNTAQEEARNFPETAHVEDSDAGGADKGETVRASAKATADSPIADFVSASDSESSTCG